jgi:predicted ATPase/DNA-binding CsgD family transcriptional regulator
MTLPIHPIRDFAGHASRGRVPKPFTAFFGREQEVALAVSLLRRDDIRLLTLSGPGGVGKTRLAIKIAGEIGGTFADGTRFISLAAVASDDHVVTTIAHELGLVAAGDMSALDVLTGHLRDADLLLIIDNVEHVLQGTAVLSDLLAECPRLKILTTSRILLRLAGEQALPVPPLDILDATSPEAMSHSAAVAMFVNRAQAVLPRFQLTADMTPVVAEICRHMDGLPLGIELAAAQIRVLAPAQLLERLRAHLPLPVAGPRDVPMRLRTVRDAVAWSYGLLTVEEQALFRSLGVFVGGFGLDAVDYVTRPAAARRPASESPHDAYRSSIDSTFDSVVSLVDKSLVRQEPWEEESWIGEPRFSMLETIRGFALEQLIGSEAEDAVRDAHAEWCLSLAEESDLMTYMPSGQQRMRRLEIEHANLRVAFGRFDRNGDRDRSLRMATALGRFWFLHGHYEEGRVRLEQALRDAEGIDSLAPAHFWLGQFRYVQGEREQGEMLIKQSADAFRARSDALHVTSALIWESRILISREEYDRAEQVLQEALGWAATIPYPSVVETATFRVLAHLGVIAHERGDLDTARALHEQALRSYREIDDVLGVIRSLRDLGDVACGQNDYTGALGFYRECLALLGKWGDPLVVVNALTGSALVAAVWGQPERSARLLGAADAAREQFRLGIDLPSERAVQERAAALGRAAVGEPAFQAVWREGRGLSLAKAIAEVQALEPPAFAIQRGDRQPALGLSPREKEVLGLLVAGQSDRQIATGLFISVRTVEGHVSHILAKLGVRTRAEAVKVAIAAGLSGSGAAEPELRN